MTKITKILPLKNVYNFHPEIRGRTEQTLERKSLVSSFTSLEDGEAIGIISTPACDQDGDIIDPMGIDTSIFNGCCVFNHNLDSLPIGNIPELIKDKDGLKGKFIFSKTYDFSIDCYNLVKEKILNAISIGYIPVKVLKRGTDAFNSYAKARGWNIEGCQRIITECLMIEASLVPVGCNSEALVLASKSFKSEMSFKTFKIEGKGCKEDENKQVVDKAIEEPAVQEVVATVSDTEVLPEALSDVSNEEVVEILHPPLDGPIDEKIYQETEIVIAPLKEGQKLLKDDVVQEVPVEAVEEVVTEVINTPLPIVEVIPEASIEVPEVKKPIVLKIVRVGSIQVTEDIKSKALKFLQGKSF